MRHYLPAASEPTIPILSLSGLLMAWPASLLPCGWRLEDLLLALGLRIASDIALASLLGVLARRRRKYSGFEKGKHRGLDFEESSFLLLVEIRFHVQFGQNNIFPFSFARTRNAVQCE